MLGDLLIRWTIRLALAAYVTTLAVQTADRVRGEPRPSSIARGLWSVGCVLAWLHVAAAFHFEHHWSQDDAWEQTARTTAAVVGLNWGGGIFFNYAFLLAWAIDAGWSWMVPTAYVRRPNLLRWLIEGYLAFITFNATVVFKTGWLRWVGIGLTAALFAARLWVRRRRGGGDK
jgi:hypothetical protein